MQPQQAITLTFLLPAPLAAHTDIKIYPVDETGLGTEALDTKISATGAITVQTQHFSQFVMLFSAAPPPPDTTTFTATVKWVGGNELIRPASTALRLYGNNREVLPSPVVVGAAEQWTHTWSGLPVKDASGNRISYVASQVPLPNTTSEIEYLNDREYAWIPADTLMDGENYLLADSTKSAMTFDSTNAQNIRATPLSFATVRVNGTATYAAVSPGDSVRWDAAESAPASGSFSLRNGSSVSLCQHKDAMGNPSALGTAVSATAQDQTLFTYQSNKLASSLNTWVLRNGASFSTTQTAAQASALQLYRQYPVDKSINFINLYQPPSPSEGGKVDYHKRIDFLGDGAYNPDSPLRGKDDYRLYLDVASSIQMPADLILVLDVSGSMDVSRMSILNSALMGETGFITRFLKANANNHLSIVCFWGARTPYQKSAVNWASDNPIVNGKINAGQDVGDATLYQNWMTAADLPRLPALFRQGVGGTNYGAGLYQAQRLIKSPPYNPSPTQYMVFMSDGVPTHALSTQSAAQVPNPMDRVAVFGQHNEYVPPNLQMPTGIYRYGTGEGTPFNTEFCKGANQLLVRNFAASNPKLNIFSIGVAVSDPDVLRNLASGTGRYLNANDFSELDETFASILGPCNVVITDALSPAVDFAAVPRPTLTAKSGTTTKILWANGAVTAAGSGIVQSVTIDAASKKAIATFVPTYTLSPDTVYTLSFDVQVTPKAYADYAASQKYPAVGDADTDYAANSTSSQRPGFYANDNASTALSYSFGADETRLQKLYQKPVVQVSADAITLQLLKTDDSAQPQPLPGAHFQLFSARFEAAGQAWVKNGAPIGTLVTGADGKGAFRQTLRPGHYFLVETKPPSGYARPKADVLVAFDGGALTLKQGQAVITKASISVWQLQLPNTRHLVLPATGGIGTRPIFFMGGGLFLLAAALCVFRVKKRPRERDNTS
ncbi:MAG: SpaA isopeptide-forming pilin-related protein [Ruthenibacterium sp.]